MIRRIYRACRSFLRAQRRVRRIPHAPDGAVVVKRPKFYVSHWSAEVGRRYRAP